MPRPPKTSRYEVVRAALKLVDEHGLGALSMRRLGDVLGVEAMSLYHHVPNKEALLDAVHEAVLTGMVIPVRTGTWRDDARALALGFRDALLAHPNAVSLFASRPAVTTGSLAYVEMGLEILSEPFADPLEQIHALQSIVGFVVGQTMLQLAPGLVDYAELDQAEFPRLVASVPAFARYDAATEFDFGLRALLAGLASAR